MVPGWSTIPLDTFTIRPQPRSSIAGTSAKVRRIGASTLTANADDHAERAVETVGPTGWTTAALFTRRSTGPSSSAAVAAAPAAAAGAAGTAGGTPAAPPSPP